MPKYAKHSNLGLPTRVYTLYIVCRSMQKNAEECRRMQKNAQVCTSMQKDAELHLLSCQLTLFTSWFLKE